MCLSRGGSLSKPPANTRWIHYGLLAIAVFYVVQVAFELFWGNACAGLALDYCTFWSVGRIANTWGYGNVYDLELLAEVQRPLFPASLDPDLFKTGGSAYFSVFIVPFQLFALLEPLPGFGLWSLINLVGFSAYLHFFFKETVWTLPVIASAFDAPFVSASFSEFVSGTGQSVVNDLCR